MSKFNIASKSKDEQDKVNVDLASSGDAYKGRLNMPLLRSRLPESSQNTFANTSWSVSATIASRASSYPAHPILVTSKWLSRTLKNSDFLACARFDFIPEVSDNYFVSLSS